MDKYRREFMELQLWREMLTPYELAVDELVLKFRHIIENTEMSEDIHRSSKSMDV